jgi:dihydrofolate reductase
VPLVSILVATDARGAIGRDGGLPWHLPNDLKRFKSLTMGKPIVMGRRTWDSIGRPLPGRLNVVITRQAAYAAAGATVVPSLDAALAAAGSVEEVCVIGGGEIYRLALPITSRIHLTRIDATVPADTFFPALDPRQWREVGCEAHPADERHAYAYSFIELQRMSRA